MAKEQHPRIRELKFTLSRIFKNPAAIIGFSLMAEFASIAIAAPYLAPPKNPARPYEMPHGGMDPTPHAPSRPNYEFSSKKLLNMKRDKEQKLPSEFYDKLKQALKGKRYEAETEAVEAIRNAIGAEATTQYQTLILKHSQNAGHIFGTTSGQYDIYYGIIWGTRTAFRIGLAICGVGLVIGVTLGLIAGYFGGWIDEIIMRFVDIMYSIPMVVLAMAIVVALGPGINKVILALAAVVWRLYVRLFRAEILTIRERDYIQAAKTMGVSDLSIMLKHIFPNAIYPVLIVASMDIGSMVISAAFMSFIGLGSPPGYADWGQMVAMARNYIIGPPDDPLKYWYTVVIPGLAIVLFVLAWNLIGDALRDAFDPKQRRR